MGIVKFLLVGIAAVLVRNSWASCPTRFGQIGMGCYVFFSSSDLSWGRAYFNCQLQLNGYLVEIESEEEQYYLTDYIQNVLQPQRNISYWIGATDVLTDGRFQWMTSGNDLTYTNWGTNEPNNLIGEDCVYMSPELKWNALPCNTEPEQGVAICERDPI